MLSLKAQLLAGFSQNCILTHSKSFLCKIKSNQFNLNSDFFFSKSEIQYFLRFDLNLGSVSIETIFIYKPLKPKSYKAVVLAILVQ
jgi:hypothetical protein